VKSAVETLNPTRVKLTVEVPFDELRPSLDAAYRTIANQVNVPGFRKGKVPPRIIDQRVGRGAVLQEAVNEALPRFYARAVEESAVRPLGTPTVDVTDVPDPAAGGDLRFTAEVDVRPTITLPSLDAVEITVDDVVVTDEDVDERVQSLRERFGTLVPVDRDAADADFVAIDISASIDGEEIDSVAGISYQVGSGTMVDGLDERLPGMSVGQAVTFITTLTGGERMGEDAEVSVTLQAVKERSLPALDDDFAQLASEFDTLEELRADLRGQVETVKRYQQGLQARERLLKSLLDGTDVPVPEGVIAQEVDRHLEAEDRTEDSEHRTEVEQEAREGIRTQLLLDAVAEAEKVSVGQQELVEYLVITAQQYGQDPNEFARMVDEAGEIPAVVAEVARRKGLAAVLSRAVVTDESGNRVDLEAALPRAAGAGSGGTEAQSAPTPPAGPGEPPGSPTGGAEGDQEQAALAAAGARAERVATGAPSAHDPTAVPVFDLPVAAPDPDEKG